MGKWEECSSPQNVWACIACVYMYMCVHMHACVCVCVCVCLERGRRSEQWLIDISVKKKKA